MTLGVKRSQMVAIRTNQLESTSEDSDLIRAIEAVKVESAKAEQKRDSVESGDSPASRLQKTLFKEDSEFGIRRSITRPGDQLSLLNQQVAWTRVTLQAPLPEAWRVEQEIVLNTDRFAGKLARLD